MLRRERPSARSRVIDLCGWRWPDLDPETGEPGAARRDVADAVAWAHGLGTTYDYTDQHGTHAFDGNVFLLGLSAGGNLAYLVGATEPPGTEAQPNPRRPEAVAGWSGPTELGQMLQPRPEGDNTCDYVFLHPPSGDPAAGREVREVHLSWWSVSKNDVRA